MYFHLFRLDSAIDKGESVLVHCLGGISRSSTIIIAYLMFKYNYPLNNAYDFVKSKKTNIAPNFNFMGQLLNLERSQRELMTPTCGSQSPGSFSDSSLSSSSCSSSVTCDSCWPIKRLFDGTTTSLLVFIHILLGFITLDIFMILHYPLSGYCCCFYFIVKI